MSVPEYAFPRSAVFAVSERVLNSIARPGSPDCSKAMHRLVRAITSNDRDAMLQRLAVPGVAETEARWLGLIKAHCGCCRSPCKRPVE